VARPIFGIAYLMINAIGALLTQLERRVPNGTYTLPMNLLVSARRPADPQ